MRSLRSLLALTLVIGSALAACSDSTSGGPGKLTVQLTDKPFPFSEVDQVEIFVVRVDAKTSETTQDEAEDASDNDGWITLAEPNALIDLIELNGGKLTTLGTTTIPSGTYRGFRLVIDPAQSSITLKDGSSPNIIWPSAAQTGIKVNLTTPVVVASDSSVFIIDFDIGRSFVMRGNSIAQNGLLFKPVVQAVATEITGSVSGTVRGDSPTGPVVAGATVELLAEGTLLDDANDENVVHTTFTDGAGVYTFGFVLPGTYVVRATPPEGSAYMPALLAGGITLANGQDLSDLTIVVVP